MSIAHGIFSMDDYVNFGKMYDELGEYASLITYVPKSGKIIVAVRREFANSVNAIAQEYNLTKVKEVDGRGTMKFIVFVMGE